MAEDTLTRKEFAVKIIDKTALLAGGDRLDVMVERRVLQLASGSPFLVHSAFAFQTKINIFFGMEYMRCGDFHQLLERNGPLDIASARFYTAELVCGIQFLHSRGVIHRDLKPENILVAETGHIKITDYGLALDNMHLDQTATGFAGTIGDMAPEILDMREYYAGVDWFSLGVIINQMLTSFTTYNPAVFDESSSGAKDIIEELLQEDPVQRLGVHGEIRQHLFFQRIDWVSVEALRMAPPYIPVASSCHHPILMAVTAFCFLQSVQNLSRTHKEVHVGVNRIALWIDSPIRTVDLWNDDGLLAASLICALLAWDESLGGQARLGAFETALEDESDLSDSGYISKILEHEAEYWITYTEQSVMNLI